MVVTADMDQLMKKNMFHLLLAAHVEKKGKNNFRSKDPHNYRCFKSIGAQKLNVLCNTNTLLAVFQLSRIFHMKSHSQSMLRDEKQNHLVDKEKQKSCQPQESKQKIFLVVTTFQSNIATAIFNILDVYHVGSICLACSL